MPLFLYLLANVHIFSGICINNGHHFLVQPVFLHLPVQCCRIDFQYRCRLFPVPVAGFKGIDDIHFLLRFVFQRPDNSCGSGLIIMLMDFCIHPLHLQYRCFRNKHGAFHPVLQFTYITRPRVGKHPASGIVGKTACFPFQFFRVTFPEKFCQRDDVLRTFRQ